LLQNIYKLDQEKCYKLYLTCIFTTSKLILTNQVALESSNCYSNYLSQWQMTVQGSKSLRMGYQVGNSQENLTRSLFSISVLFIQKLMVRATNNKFCSHVYASFSFLPYVLLKATMYTLCALTSSSRPFHHVLGLWHHIMWLHYHMPLHHSLRKRKSKRKIKVKLKNKWKENKNC